MKCFNCGAELTDDTKFCSYCGVKITEQSPKKEDDPAEEKYIEPETEVVEDEPIIPEAPAIKNNNSTKKDTVGDKAKSKLREFWNGLSMFGKLATISGVASAFLGLIAFLAGRVFAGVIAIVWLAVVVVALLMKKNVIKVPKTWIPLVAIILSFVLIIPYFSLFKVNMADYEKYNWNEVVLADMLPTPESPYGEIISNSDSYLALYVNKATQEEYTQYIEACKEKGFTIDTETTGSFFYAYNEAGYKLSLSYYDYSSEMHINLTKGRDLGTLEWSSGELAQMLPVPESTVGEIQKDDEKGFTAYVGNTTIDAFNSYVQACEAKGFTVDADKTDKRYSAKNADGYKLAVEYQGNNVIYISLDEPEYKVTIEVECVENLIFSKYDVEVYVDDSLEGTITHGDTETFELTLTKGTYVLKFVNEENDEVDGEVEFYIEKDEDLKYKISCTSSKVNVDIITGSSEEKPTDGDNQQETTEPPTTEEPDAPKITVTMSEDDFIGMLYTDAEAKLREMGFTVFEYETLDTTDINKPDDTIGAVEIKSWSFGKGDFEVGDTYESDAIVVLWYYICDEPVPNLTADNCPDLAALLALKDPCDPSVSTFSSKYRGQVIEFDGCVTAMQNHGSYTTRWDVLLGAGDFDENSMRGPNFRLTDVNYYDMNVSGGDSVYVGLNVHVIAEVGSYNANTSLFELDIISIEIRD